MRSTHTEFNKFATHSMLFFIYEINGIFIHLGDKFLNKIWISESINSGFRMKVTHLTIRKKIYVGRLVSVIFACKMHSFVILNRNGISHRFTCNKLRKLCVCVFEWLTGDLCNMCALCILCRCKLILQWVTQHSIQLFAIHFAAVILLIEVIRLLAFLLMVEFERISSQCSR